MSTLAHLPERAFAKVVALPCGRGLAARLIALGLTPGCEVCVLQNRGRGPVIVEVHGARVALGRGQAEKVLVEPKPGAEEPDPGHKQSGNGRE